jgi:hypothetical protein
MYAGDIKEVEREGCSSGYNRGTLQLLYITLR